MPRTHNPKTHLAPHIERKSRTQKAHKRGAQKGSYKGTPAAKEEPPQYKEVTVGGGKNGEKRLVPTEKAPKYYPAEDVKKPKKHRKTLHPPRLRDSLHPGQVVILVAGRFKGKRVVFLKQLASGLLLVTGPFKLNGVPLKRVNQAYVIATSSRLDLHGVEKELKHDHIDDAYFSKSKTSTPTSKEEEYFSGGKPKPKDPHPGHKITDQQHVDKHVLQAIKKVPSMDRYLSATWGLSKGQFPHRIVF